MRIRTSIIIAMTALFVSAQGVIGADCYWLVAMGNAIFDQGHIPDGVPFAAATTAGWPNVPVLAEMFFAAMNHVGPGMLLGAQVMAVAVAFCLVAVGARSLGAGDAETAAVLLALALGALPALAVVRLQLVSLVPFVLLVVLLRRQAMQPFGGNLADGSRSLPCGGISMELSSWAWPWLARIWLSPDFGSPLGWQFRSASPQLLRSTPTPPALDTWRYYAGVLRNEAAQRHSELWARPSLDNGFDLLLAASAVMLIPLALRRRRPLWEYVAVCGLAVGTVLTARNGLWLLLFCAAPAAAGLTSQRPFSMAPRLRSSAKSPIILLGVGLSLAAFLSVHRAAEVLPVSDQTTVAVAKLAAGGVLLAPEPAAESFAAGGARVWLANPIDAFERSDQAAYLDFLAGGPRAARAVASADLVVAQEGTELAKRLARSATLQPVPNAPGWLYFRPTP